MEFWDDSFAEDTTLVICAPADEELRVATVGNVGCLGALLAGVSLILCADKSRKIVLRPHLLPEGIYRWTAAQTFPDTKKRVMTQLRAVAAGQSEIVEFDPGQETPELVRNVSGDSPFPDASTMRISGA